MKPGSMRRVHREQSALDGTLKFLGANAPARDDIAAIRALTRGNATPGQQRRAMTYILGELCQLGSVTFAGENTHGASFRAGAQGVGHAIAQIGGAVLMRFPADAEEPESGAAEDVGEPVPPSFT